MVASEEGNEGVVSVLLDHDKSYHHVNHCSSTSGTNALSLATSSGHEGCLRRLLEAGSEEPGKYYYQQNGRVHRKEGKGDSCQILLEVSSGGDSGEVEEDGDGGGIGGREKEEEEAAEEGWW